MDELLAAAAAAMKMSPKMVQRSAEAKAKAQGVSVEAILAEWAGVEAPQAPSTAPTAAPESVTPPAAAAGTPDAPAPATVDAGSLLAAAAAVMKMPPKMVQRSAEAKAKAQGVSVEAILAEWAGVEAPQAPSAPAATGATAPTTPAAGPADLDVEVIGGPAEEPPAPGPQPTPAKREAVVPAGALPRWLAALFVVIPAFAIAYATFLPNGPNCGDAGRLGVDPVTGAAANCDGSALGSSTTDYYTLGAEIYESVGCAACHGSGGAGGGNFPGFTGGALLAAFPTGQCAVQVEWVKLGSNGWPEPTYGANNKAVGGSGAIMPAWESTLTEDEIRAVVLFERVAFGGEDLTAALADCAPPEGTGDSASSG